MRGKWEMKRDEMGHRCCGKHKVLEGFGLLRKTRSFFVVSLLMVIQVGVPYPSLPVIISSLSNSLTTFSFINQTLISIYTYVRGIIMSFQPKIIWQ